MNQRARQLITVIKFIQQRGDINIEYVSRKNEYVSRKNEFASIEDYSYVFLFRTREMQ